MTVTYRRRAGKLNVVSFNKTAEFLGITQEELKEKMKRKKFPTLVLRILSKDTFMIGFHQTEIFEWLSKQPKN